MSTDPKAAASVEPVTAETQANRDAADVFLDEFCKEHCAERIALLEGLLREVIRHGLIGGPSVLHERIRAALGEG